MLKWDAGPNIKYATVGFTQSKPFSEAGKALIKHKKKEKRKENNNLVGLELAMFWYQIIEAIAEVWSMCGES